MLQAGKLIWSLLMLPPVEAPASHKSLACSLLLLLLSDEIIFHIFCWAVAACMLMSLTWCLEAIGLRPLVVPPVEAGFVYWFS